MSTARITSTQHPLVKRVRALRLAKTRAAEQEFVAEGVKLVCEALAAGADPVSVLISPRLEEDASGRELLARLAPAGGRVHRLAERALAAAADTETPQGVIAVFRRPALAVAALARPRTHPLLVVAEGIQEPGNVGALVRVAEAFSASGFIAVGGADPFGPKAVRASAASVFRLPIAEATDAGDALDVLRRAGYRLVAAVARDGAPPGPELRSRPLALLLGSEGGGLDPVVIAGADARVSIPLAHPVESLNVAAAAAILLHCAVSRP